MSHPEEALLRRLDDERIAAMLAGDVERLNELVDDDLHYSHSWGFESKRSWLDQIASGSIQYISIEYDVQKIHVNDHTSLHYGVMNGDLLIGGERKIHRHRVLAVWTKHGENWKFTGYFSAPREDANENTRKV